MWHQTCRVSVIQSFGRESKRVCASARCQMGCERAALVLDLQFIKRDTRRTVAPAVRCVCAHQTQRSHEPQNMHAPHTRTRTHAHIHKLWYRKTAYERTRSAAAHTTAKHFESFKYCACSYAWWCVCACVSVVWCWCVSLAACAGRTCAQSVKPSCVCVCCLRESRSRTLIWFKMCVRADASAQRTHARFPMPFALSVSNKQSRSEPSARTTSTRARAAHTHQTHNWLRSLRLFNYMRNFIWDVYMHREEGMVHIHIQCTNVRGRFVRVCVCILDNQLRSLHTGVAQTVHAFERMIREIIAQTNALLGLRETDFTKKCAARPFGNFVRFCWRDFFLNKYN